MFHKFYNRIEIEAEMIAVTALHVGAGQGSFQPSAVRAPLLKNINGQPYIPGSSIKGVLRSFLESLSEDACYMGEKCTKPFNNGEDRKTLKNMISKKGYMDIEYYAAQEMAAKSCSVCRLFGSNVIAAKIHISDAIIETTVSTKTETRQGNAIDRDTHTARDRALFSIETIPSGTIFKVRIVAENLTQAETENFAQLLEYFAQGNIKIGGIHRSGLGKVKLQNMKLQVMRREEKKFPKPVEETLKEGSNLYEKLQELIDGAYDEEPVEVLNVQEIGK